MKYLLTTFAFLFLVGAIQYAAAQELGGGVDKEGSWYVGEGLKTGDRFEYSVCYVDYKECKPLVMDFWIKGDIVEGTETKWLVETVVYDGKKIIKGQMHLGKIAPEPTGGSSELRVYASVFKSSIVWLSAFATSYGGEGGEGPKAFKDISWSNWIYGLGGPQVKPTMIGNVSTKQGIIEDAVQLTWLTRGGYTNEVWIVDEFPFPVKASTWVYVSEGIPRQEYKFELLEYEDGVTKDPYADIVSTELVKKGLNCSEIHDRVKIKKTTSGSSYMIDLLYSPSEIKFGCDINWIINFHSTSDEADFLYNVQYDIWVEDPTSKEVIKSLAADEGTQFLFSPSGQAIRSMNVDTLFDPTKYIIVVYGLAPKDQVPSTLLETLEINVPFDGSNLPTTLEPAAVPEWIKNSASFWVQGHTSDEEFISAIQYLVNQGVIILPPTESGSSTDEGIPDWIKQTVGFWVDGHTSDDEFVSAIQYLVKQGTIVLS